MNRSKYVMAVVKLATIPEAMERYRLGRNALMKLATDENAIRRFGRSVRIDVTILDRAIEQY